MSRRIAVTVVAVIVSAAAALIAIDAYQGRMRQREYGVFISIYERIELGRPLKEAEAVIGITPGGVPWNTGEVIKTINEEYTEHNIGFASEYLGRYHEILVYYDPLSARITGKRLVSKRSRSFYSRIFKNQL